MKAVLIMIVLENKNVFMVINMTNRITIHDVAKAANVSIATVSKALNGVDVVKPATKKRILETAEKLHYVPNVMGKQLKSGRTKMLGFYTNTISGPYFSPLVEAMAKEAERLGYGINVFITNDKQIITNSIRGNMVDGIIGFEDLIDEQELEAIKREKIKAVFIDRRTCSETIGSVVFDSFQTGQTATNYLLTKGHQRIAFVLGFEGVYDSDERFKGYQAALSNAKISFDKDIVLQGSFEEKDAYHAVQEFLKQDAVEKPSAFLAGNDLSAIGVIKGLRDLGYQVPQDFSVIGFDGIDLLEYFEPRLTTIENPIEQQAQLAVQHLIALITGEQEGQSFELSGKLLEGQSVKKYKEKE